MARGRGFNRKDRAVCEFNAKVGTYLGHLKADVVLGQPRGEVQFDHRVDERLRVSPYAISSFTHARSHLERRQEALQHLQPGFIAVNTKPASKGVWAFGRMHGFLTLGPWVAKRVLQARVRSESLLDGK